MKKIIIIIAVALVIIGLGVILAMQDNKNRRLIAEEDQTLAAVGQELPDEGRAHIAVGAAHEPYHSNPPTSGPHYAQAADWGIYPDPLPDEQVVHNLEHGGIWISYKDIDADTKAKLEAIAKANSGSVIMTPRPQNDARIVLASWTRLEKLGSYDEGKILEFIRANKNKAPEPLAR
jgi:hypothetical protein